ncbi:Uncharacterized [Syntrophomonas zehnderi OL-4]|uniref:Uncharacterized n=2 Tax=Syntrophomonas TaxID=862 RepID=A0A0E4C945_9FIRM|nr:Uncharacterized [Syntrophomonas zehnderi OL-4]
MRKIICMGILILMTVFCSVPALATEGAENTRQQNVITPQFTYISLLNAGLSINSSGKVTSIGHASAYDRSHTTRLTVKLEKSTGNGWSTIKSWSASSTGQSVAGIEEAYYVVHDTYRVCATAKVYNAAGNLLESKSAYSDTATY